MPRPVVVASACTIVLTFVPLLAAAQSGPPGQCDCAPPAPAHEPPPAWAAQKIGVALRVGSLGLGERDSAEHQEVSTGGLGVRLRVSRRLELEAAIDHGEPRDGSGDRVSITSATAAALLQLRPDAPLGGYLLAGLGATTRQWGEDGPKDTRGHLAVGAGVEYRFRHLVIGAEVRLLALGEGDRDAEVEPAGLSAAAPSGEERDGLGGGQVTLSGGWYF
jgi:hypothetical protein